MPVLLSKDLDFGYFSKTFINLSQFQDKTNESQDEIIFRVKTFFTVLLVFCLLILTNILKSSENFDKPHFLVDYL